MTQQPEALMLARALEGEAIPWTRHEVAAELRRLHELNEDLYQQGVGFIARITTLEAALQQARQSLSEIAALKRHDPCKGRSNAGKWVVWTAPAELAEKVDAAKQALEGKA